MAGVILLKLGDECSVLYFLCNVSRSLGDEIF